ncbi:hypothetical protein M422DRAFT_263655 [Sphaerobolus stellatus SS14]|uniref:Uncharacterized protein n=1 Tax=Sphaerobolus stellatus (strain SS14) TaxID=990650 RepID=A0A0C9UYH0_SPHS4|nr:hypothetical protein M422DRAFT_263655 [Sphaerobolus stellatus SS14]
MNILSIFQASTELEEISIEFDTHGQSTPTSSSHRISLKSLKNVFLVGTDAAQLMDYIEAPSLEQLSVYFGYALGLIVIRHLIPWIDFPSIKALIVREKSSWDVDGIHMDRSLSRSQRRSKNGWQYAISGSNPRSEYEDAKSDCRFYFATSRNDLNRDNGILLLFLKRCVNLQEIEFDIENFRTNSIYPYIPIENSFLCLETFNANAGRLPIHRFPIKFYPDCTDFFDQLKNITIFTALKEIKYTRATESKISRRSLVKLLHGRIPGGLFSRLPQPRFCVENRIFCIPSLFFI